MNPTGGNRFDDFFADDAYVRLKNHLYNYLLRRREIRKCMPTDKNDLILEVGSGLSPMTDAEGNVVYSDLSFPALRNLKHVHGGNAFVVADVTRLPFRDGQFSHVICSEVLEHLPDDKMALRKIASVMKPGGSLILTIPHRRCYFAGDDRFVNHFRRYELDEIQAMLAAEGLKVAEVRKVLGPLEKISMVVFFMLLSFCNRFQGAKQGIQPGKKKPWKGCPVTLFHWLNRLYCIPIWLDTRLAPISLSSVILIRAVR